LFHKSALLPEGDEGSHLLLIHEGDEVDVSVGLAFQDHRRGEALVAHALGEGLVVGAVVVHLVGVGLHGRARLALLIGAMLSLAFLLHFKQEVLERLVLSLDLRGRFRTVRTFLVRRVGALVLY